MNPAYAESGRSSARHTDVKSSINSSRFLSAISLGAAASVERSEVLKPAGGRQLSSILGKSFSALTRRSLRPKDSEEDVRRLGEAAALHAVQHQGLDLDTQSPVGEGLEGFGSGTRAACTLT